MLKVFGKGCGGEPFLRKVSPTIGAYLSTALSVGIAFKAAVETVNHVFYSIARTVDDILAGIFDTVNGIVYVVANGIISPVVIVTAAFGGFLGDTSGRGGVGDDLGVSFRHDIMTGSIGTFIISTAGKSYTNCKK